jgi:pimeloyl-ACP methyl ester carboxylesterase
MRMAPRYEPAWWIAADSAIAFRRTMGPMWTTDSEAALAVRREVGTGHRIAATGRRGRWIALLAGGALIAASCSGGSGSGEPPPATRDVSGVATTVAPTITAEPGATPTQPLDPPEPLEYSIEWEDLGNRVDAGTITVPLDYADPQGETIELAIVRHRADENRRIGSLLANRGGPGAPGTVVAENATSWFGSDVTDNFDVVAWDPRGTGQSGGAVDCIDDDEYDRFYSMFDVTPDDEAERAALVDIAEEFAQRCIDRVPELQYIGTNNSARDMDAMRQALGEVQISYFGWSYGSELGGVWATMFPTTVRAAVFDGATDPEADPVEQTRQQWVGFEAALNTFLADCSANSSCTFHNDGDAEGAFDTLFAGLDGASVPSADGRAAVDLGVAVTAVVQSMYSDRYWPALERALEDAAAGDGAGLLQLQDAYYGRNPDGTYGNLLEAFQAITCADEEERPTVEESDADASELIGVAPRLFPFTTGSYSCSFFPDSLDPRIDITGIDAGPIVVIGTTGDPATPLASSQAMAATLEEGVLVTVEANQHSGYRANNCIDDIVHEYLVQLIVPEDGTVCS